MKASIPKKLSPARNIERLLNEFGWTQQDLADVMGRPVQAVNQIVAGSKSITMATARGLAAAFGNENGTAEEWLRLQLEYRIAIESADPDDSSEVSRRARLHSLVPLREMAKRGWLPRCESIDDTEAAVAEFFGVRSLGKISPPEFCARARVKVPAQDAWAQRALTLSRSLPQLARYSEKKLRNSLGSLREMCGNPEKITEALSLVANVGVRLVFVQHLSKTRIDGAAFWIRPRTQPVIALSLRFGRIDYFAFTLLHELCHIMERHESGLDTEILAASASLSEQEQSANRWAADTLVPESAFADFLEATKAAPSRISIERFAASIEIHPGIVVGQLQNKGVVGYSSHRDLLADVRDTLLGQRDSLQSQGVAVFDGWADQKEEKESR